jgi:hypothetical protein
VHRDASWWLGFSGKKPFYHGSRPLPLSNPGKLLIFRRLGYGPFRFWGNSWENIVQLAVGAALGFAAADAFARVLDHFFIRRNGFDSK